MSVGLTVCPLSPDYSELAFLFLEIKSMSRLFLGCGINDRKYPSFINGKNVKEYHLWGHILTRCYSKNSLAAKPTYIGCTVSDNFKNYSYFYEWCQSQIGFGLDGWHLDKDIIISGNKVYSEDTCVFVPQEINKFFTDRGALRGKYPIGVNFDKPSGKYKAECCVNGKSKNLGRFTTPEDAHAVYKTFKEALCKETANKWRGQIDPRVYDAMMAWAV